MVLIAFLDLQQPILGAYAGKRSNISTDRRREINRESARRIRAKKLAEASSLRDKVRILSPTHKIVVF